MICSRSAWVGTAEKQGVGEHYLRPFRISFPRPWTPLFFLLFPNPLFDPHSMQAMRNLENEAHPGGAKGKLGAGAEGESVGA